MMASVLVALVLLDDAGQKWSQIFKKNQQINVYYY